MDKQGHFLDPYGMPYFYFSSKHGNDYDFWGRTYSSLFNTAGYPTFNQFGGYGYMNPHVSLDGKYLEPNGYQIISSGKDQVPGPGGVPLNQTRPYQWDPQTQWPGGGAYKVNRSDIPNVTGGGADDLGNWTAYQLGSDR
jgi:hypothetical protein